MLVEDDNNLREIYGERLLAEGYEIVSASDGEEALALAVKEKPDLIISDVMMPKISGFDMLDILRQTPETKNTQVIMMTALSQAEDKERADKLGADKYLVKSQVTLEDVARVVHDMLYGPEPEAAPESPAPAAPIAMPLSQPPEITPQPVAATPIEPAITEATPLAVESPAAPAPIAVQPSVTVTSPVVVAPEPALTSVTPQPTPVVEPVAEPAAPVIEPLTFTPPTPTPASTPEPVTTAPEPLIVEQSPAPEAAVVTPPEAVAAPTETPEPVVIVEPILGIPSPAEAAVEPTDAPSEPVVNAESAVTGETTDAALLQMPDDTADLISEQAEVNERINSFANAEPTESTAHSEPLVEPSEEPPTVTPAEPISEPAAGPAPEVIEPTAPESSTAAEVLSPESTEEPEPANIPRPMDENVAESASTRKKVIEPIVAANEQPNINELYEKEMAAEAANTPVANPGAGFIVGEPAAPAASTGIKDPADPTSFAL
jgi:CheY-like chemotaxis protein